LYKQKHAKRLQFYKKGKDDDNSEIHSPLPCFDNKFASVDFFRNEVTAYKQNFSVF